MSANTSATQNQLREGARDIARTINMDGKIDFEYVRKGIRRLAASAHVVYSTASDVVYDELTRLDGVQEDIVNAYQRMFPTPKPGR